MSFCLSVCLCYRSEPGTKLGTVLKLSQPYFSGEGGYFDYDDGDNDNTNENDNSDNENIYIYIFIFFAFLEI